MPPNLTDALVKRLSGTMEHSGMNAAREGLLAEQELTEADYQRGRIGREECDRILAAIEETRKRLGLGEQPSQRSRKLVLVADDEPNIVDTYAVTLRTNGYDVMKAYDGENAVGLAVENEPDVAVIGVVMPGMNGIEAARRILSACPQCKILLMLDNPESPLVDELWAFLNETHSSVEWKPMPIPSQELLADVASLASPLPEPSADDCARVEEALEKARARRSGQQQEESPQDLSEAAPPIREAAAQEIVERHRSNLDSTWNATLEYLERSIASSQTQPPRGTSRWSSVLGVVVLLVVVVVLAKVYAMMLVGILAFAAVIAVVVTVLYALVLMAQSDLEPGFKVIGIIALAATAILGIPRVLEFLDAGVSRLTDLIGFK